MGIEIDGANQKLILDSDGDTYIEGATDDTLKVYVSGAQDFTITANTLTAESGSTIAAQALTATTVTASGVIKTDDATEATSTTDGSLQTDGGLSVVKDTVMGDDLKLLSDASVIHFGANSEITLTHSHDAGLNLKHTATADDKPVVLTLQTGETDIAQDDVIGALNFQAPDEGTGTDAILVAAGIAAISEGDFSSSNNATKLSFKTAASEAASEKASLSSTGVFTATSFAGSGAGLTAGTTPLTTLDIDGGTDIGAAIVDADLFIVDDGAGGTNRKTAASRLKTYIGGGITMADQWRYTTQTQGNVSPITSNLERVDGTAQGTLGSSLMSESSGIFTFPSTGIYLVRLDVGAYINNAKDRTWGAQIQITNDNSNYNELALASGNLFDSDDNTTETIGCQTLIDVTNTTNIKVRFAVFFNNQNSYINGSSSVNKSMFTFTRLGDT